MEKTVILNQNRDFQLLYQRGKKIASPYAIIYLRKTRRKYNRLGVRLRASAPSIHMMRADIRTTVSPIVGTERQSEELVMYLLEGFEEDPTKIWSSNIFGKSLHELVGEGLHNKLSKMPMDARLKLQETLQRIINEGCSGLICFIL